jgi:hypothetical protein
MPATDFGSDAAVGAPAVVVADPEDVATDAARGRPEDACGPRSVACAVAPADVSSKKAAIHLNPSRLIDCLTALCPQQRE